MSQQKKVKSLIALAFLIVITLAVVVVFQLVSIAKINQQIESQNQQIEQLEKELDYWQNKLPNSDFETMQQGEHYDNNNHR